MATTVVTSKYHYSMLYHTDMLVQHTRTTISALPRFEKCLILLWHIPPSIRSRLLYADLPPNGTTSDSEEYHDADAHATIAHSDVTTDVTAAAAPPPMSGAEELKHGEAEEQSAEESAEESAAAAVAKGESDDGEGGGCRGEGEQQEGEGGIGLATGTESGGGGGGDEGRGDSAPASVAVKIQQVPLDEVCTVQHGSMRTRRRRVVVGSFQVLQLPLHTY